MATRVAPSIEVRYLALHLVHRSARVTHIQRAHRTTGQQFADHFALALPLAERIDEAHKLRLA